jgi:S-DNA-T family DNA segregation ATPase FtsK/SpoIIIE
MPKKRSRRNSRRRSTSRGRGRGSSPARGARRASARARELRDDARDAFGRLEQRHLDLIGLGLVALAVYLGFVLYAGWDGGRAGEWTKTGLTHAVGQVSYVIPIALAGWAAALIMRPMIEAPAAVNAGGILVLAALLLGFAAQTAGLGPEHPVRHENFDSRFYVEHGGAVGEGLYWAATTLFQRLGAHILALLMFVSGALLLTGVTISGLLTGMGRAARRAHEGTRELAQTALTIRAENAPEAWGEGEEISITRANPTEPLVTEALAGGDGEESPSDADGPEWEGTEVSDEDAEGVPEEPAYGDDGEHGEVQVAKAEPERTPMGEARGVTASEEVDYRMPEAKLLDRGKADPGPDTRDREAVAKALLEALQHFGVDARLVGTVSGPHVSRYELQLAPGTKVGAIAKLKDDLAYALASTEIRILAPIPGKKAVGVEVPNQRRRLVRLGDIYAGRPRGSSPLTVWLGKDVSGHAISTDLALMPHALVAGTTGSGKSGCINTMLCSTLMHASPNELRLVLVDPKRVELNHYEKLPHLLTPVVTNPRLAATVLANLIGEMETRYAVMGEARARNLAELNKARKRSGEPTLPHILCVIDELADLMMVAPAEVEDSIIRLAQKSRAVGIHLVLATQRPSTDVITGTIKVNIPARIAFAVASQVDSRVILDGGGAESLLGQGDMLFRPVGTSKLQRIQGAFVTEEEIGKLTAHWSRQGEPEFDEELLEARAETAEDGDEDFSPDQDDLLEDAARIVVQSDTASVSMLQRRLRVGYTRAGRLIDMLERRGIISGYEGSKPRQVLVNEGDLQRALGGAEPAEADDLGEGDDGPATETEMEPVGG